MNVSSLEARDFFPTRYDTQFISFVFCVLLGENLGGFFALKVLYKAKNAPRDAHTV